MKIKLIILELKAFDSKLNKLSLTIYYKKFVSLIDNNINANYIQYLTEITCPNIVFQVCSSIMITK